MAALGVVVLVILARAPLLFQRPRLWAEEGSRYFAYAYYYAGGPLWYRGLTHIQSGYYAFWPNLATTLAANLVPLQRAPLLTTLMALFVQLIPAALILWGQSDLWDNGWKKGLAIGGVLFAPLSGEVWLNTINSQFFFSLIVVLILQGDVPPGRPKQWCHRILLLLGGLTGVLSAVLAPLFAFVACLERKRERWIQAALLGFCAALQGGIVLSSATAGTARAVRWGRVDVATIAAVLWTQSIALVLFGFETAHRLALRIAEILASGRQMKGVGFLLLAGGVLMLAFAAGRLSWKRRVALLGCYLGLLVFSVVGSLAESKLDLVFTGNGSRYFYVPNVILILLILSALPSHRAAWAKGRPLLFAALLAAALYVGLAEYRQRVPVSADWPDWRREIALFQDDPEHLVEIWPPDWRLGLQRYEPGAASVKAE